MTPARSDDRTPSAAPADADEDGYTAVELLIVATLVIILAALAVPVTTAAIDSNRVRNAASFTASKISSFAWLRSIR